MDHFKKLQRHLWPLVWRTAWFLRRARKLKQMCREGFRLPIRWRRVRSHCTEQIIYRIARPLADTNRRSGKNCRSKIARSGEQVGNITASFGVAEPEPGESAESLIERADKLLYEAKSLDTPIE
ncbi:hypothetical protein O9992_25930 [Vibrio lentus]|nr:hypothetical protein [Vibrio lentus]